MRSIFPSLLLLACLISSATAGNIGVINNSFETPDLGSGAFAYAYVGTETGGSGPISSSTPGIGWIFSTSGAGIAANGSNFGVNFAPNGNSDGTMSTSGQAGVIQRVDGTKTSGSASYIEQMLTGFDTGTATINFEIFGRHALGPNTIDVYLDNTLLATITPPVSVFTLESIMTNVTSGSHTLWFVGHNPTADNSSFIDAVTVTNNPVPEPSALVLAASAIIFFGTLRFWRWQRAFARPDMQCESRRGKSARPV